MKTENIVETLKEKEILELFKERMKEVSNQIFDAQLKINTKKR